ncbi:unnamed protein product [Cuscuta campestris]|uniref:Uncharacterized protein n=1 Tax=Cuscuta campestris TaxID=132261 RepID=A0A484KSP0_9ASTE|nr:unnamed protein product [Cuscuta campestris]
MLTADDSRWTLPSPFGDPCRGAPCLNREGSQLHPILAGRISVAVAFNSPAVVAARPAPSRRSRICHRHWNSALQLQPKSEVVAAMVSGPLTIV